jgi:hypothetical protein
MTDARRRVIATARMLRFVREAPEASNGGRWVEAIQRIGGTSKGNPWCAAFVSTVLGLTFAGKNPLPYTASCDVLLEHARTKKWLRDGPTPGCVFLRLKSDHDADHTGFVTETADAHHWTSIEGNANNGGSREGVGVFELVRPKGKERYVFIDYPETP